MLDRLPRLLSAAVVQKSCGCPDRRSAAYPDLNAHWSVLPISHCYPPPAFAARP